MNDTIPVTVETTTVADRFVKYETWKAKQDAGILYRIVVDIVRADNDHVTDHHRVSLLLMLAAKLSGISYNDLWYAVQELAAAERLHAQRLWENRRGLAQHPYKTLSIPTPKHDAVQDALRF